VDPLYLTKTPKNTVSSIRSLQWNIWAAGSGGVRMDFVISDSCQHYTGDRSDSIWRYLDLWKFVSLLASRSLRFARADTLGDAWEGALSEATLLSRPARAEALAAQIREATGGSSWSAEDVIRTYANSSEQMQYRVMINSWYLGNGESAAMWKLYSSPDGVAIRSTAGKLMKELPANVGDSAISLDPIRYVEYSLEEIPEERWNSPFLFKRRSFEHEREIRAHLLHRNPAPTGLLAPVDLDALVEAVYVAPASPSWHREVVESLCRSYGLDAPVHQSAIDDPALR
jgi:hypothetical protein